MKDKSRTLNILQFLVRWGSLATMALAIFFFVSNAFFWVRAESATGIVIGEKAMEQTLSGSRRNISSPPAYAPFVRFKTASGEEVTFLSNVGYGKGLNYGTDTEVAVLYLAGDPKAAKVKSYSELFGLPVVLFAFGGVFWLVGIFLQFLSEPAQKKTGRPRPNV